MVLHQQPCFFGNPIIFSFSALITWNSSRPSVVMVIWRFMKAAMKVPITLLTRGGDTFHQLFTRTNTTPAPTAPQQQQQQTAVIRKQQYEHGVQTLPRETHWFHNQSQHDSMSHLSHTVTQPQQSCSFVTICKWEKKADPVVLGCWAWVGVSGERECDDPSDWTIKHG